MQSLMTDGPKTYLAGEALECYRRVKIETGTTSNPPEVVYADAGEDCIGITLIPADDGEEVTVQGLAKDGTFLAEAADSFAVGANLYGAADGKVSDTPSGTSYFKALQAAGANGDVVEIAVHPFVATTAATVSVADSGGFTTETTVEGALAEIYQDILTEQATIPIPLGAITMEDGTVLTKQATTVAGIAQLADKEQVIDIPVNCTSGEALGFTVPIPQDLDDAKDITVHVLAGKAADLDALTLDCEVYPCAAGDTANADIQDTAAQTITQAASELVFTCGADGVPAAPGTLSVILTLGGTNDGDAVYIYGAWIEYARKALTA
jgi:hypothetical protein